MKAAVHQTLYKESLFVTAVTFMSLVPKKVLVTSKTISSLNKTYLKIML